MASFNQPLPPAQFFNYLPHLEQQTTATHPSVSSPTSSPNAFTNMSTRPQQQQQQLLHQEPNAAPADPYGSYSPFVGRTGNAHKPNHHHINNHIHSNQNFDLYPNSNNNSSANNFNDANNHHQQVHDPVTSNHQATIEHHNEHQRLQQNQQQQGQYELQSYHDHRPQPSTSQKADQPHQPQESTKVCVMVDSKTPIILKIPLEPSRITLAELKHALPAINQPTYKYFYDAKDSEFGFVKEEIHDDHDTLPIYNDRIKLHVVTPNGFADDFIPHGPKSDNTCNLTYSNTSYRDGTPSLMTTDFESTSYFVETEDDSRSCTNSSRSSSSSSSESQSDVTAVHCLTVNLVLTNENFLGLHIYANTMNDIDNGIYVDEVTQNSAVALDGRIEPGDRLIRVNDISLEDLSNDDAVRVLKEAVIKRGPIKLVVAKFEPISSRPRDEIQPIDTAAWVAHAQAITIPNHNHFMDHINSATSSPSFGSNAQDTDCIRPASAGITRFASGLRLNKNTDIKEMIQFMKMPEFGLDIKNRDWLKIVIPNAFLGSQLIGWLERNVHGFANTRDAKKFAGRMLKEGYIRDPISKKSFSSKSYYAFVN